VVGWPLTTTAAAGAQESSAAGFVPVTDAMLQNPAPEDWLSFRRTLDAWGYSPLDRIMRENVARIRMEWTRSMADGSAETTPLAYDGVLYVANTRDVIQAFSAETGDLIWEYRRDLPEDVWGYTGPLARKTRNIAIWGEYILGTSADHYAYALGPRPSRCSRPAAVSCSEATRVAVSGPWTRRPARCCGRSTWGRRSWASRSRMPSRTASTWPSTRVRAG
jgi:alcohol dehydrogenase (cytochrome c)